MEHTRVMGSELDFHRRLRSISPGNETGDARAKELLLQEIKTQAYNRILIHLVDMSELYRMPVNDNFDFNFYYSERFQGSVEIYIS
jgi:hypothetical protein